MENTNWEMEKMPFRDFCSSDYVWQIHFKIKLNPKVLVSKMMVCIYCVNL